MKKNNVIYVNSSEYLERFCFAIDVLDCSIDVLNCFHNGHKANENEHAREFVFNELIILSNVMFAELSTFLVEVYNRYGGDAEIDSNRKQIIVNFRDRDNYKIICTLK